MSIPGVVGTAVGLFQDSIRLSEEYGNPLNLAEAHRDLGKMHVAKWSISQKVCRIDKAWVR